MIQGGEGLRYRSRRSPDWLKNAFAWQYPLLLKQLGDPPCVPPSAYHQARSASFGLHGPAAKHFLTSQFLHVAVGSVVVCPPTEVSPKINRRPVALGDGEPGAGEGRAAMHAALTIAHRRQDDVPFR